MGPIVLLVVVRILAGVSIAAVFWSRAMWSKQLFPFAIAVGSSAIVEFIAYVSMATHGSNIIVYNFFMPIEFMLLIWYAYLQVGGTTRKFLPVVILAYLFLWSIEMGSMAHPSSTMTTNAFALGIIVLSPLYFFLLYKEADRTEGSLLRSPHFWANFSIVLSFVTLGPAMGLLRYLVQEASPLAVSITILFPLIAILRFALSITSMWVYRKYHLSMIDARS